MHGDVTFMLIVGLSLVGFIRISSRLAIVPSPSSCRSGGVLLTHCVEDDVVSGKIVSVVDDRSKRSNSKDILVASKIVVCVTNGLFCSV